MSSRAPPPHIMDVLASQDLLNPARWRLDDLVPKDLQAEHKRIRREMDAAGVPALPQLDKMAAENKTLAEELELQKQELKDLQKSLEVQSSGRDKETVTMTQMLSTVARELRQLMEGFTRCHASNMAMWCVKPPENMSQLGPRLERVHGLLETFTSLCEDMHAIKELHTKIFRKKNYEDGERLKQQAFLLLPTAHSLTKISLNTLQILEESIHRQQSGFKSRFPDLIRL